MEPPALTRTTAPTAPPAAPPAVTIIIATSTPRTAPIRTPSPRSTTIRPRARFSAEPERGQAPLAVRFINQSTGTITSYAWDFNGDSVTDSALASPAPYMYTNPGVYQARLTVVGTGDDSHTYRMSI